MSAELYVTRDSSSCVLYLFSICSFYSISAIALVDLEFPIFGRITIIIRHNITGSTPALTDLCHFSAS